MITMSLAEVATVTGGDVHDADPATTISGAVSVDSRLVEPDGLFAAIRGERVDGHDFAEAAVRAGAGAVLAGRPVGVPAVVVADPVAALGRLARHVVDQLVDCCVIAITGSQGKTTTKDLLASVLEQIGETVAPAGNFNNEIGVPLTALRARHSTRYLVVEMGARGTGQIAYLCTVTPPDVAVVLNVGVAHIGAFGGRAQIAAAKSELVAALPSSGLAVLNADDPLVVAMADRCAGRLLTFGAVEAADVRVSDVTLDGDGRAGFCLAAQGDRVPVRLQLVGEHQALNAAAAAAVSLGCGADLARTAALLERATARSPWRMDVRRRADGVTIVNDAYNANPTSMQAALRTLSAMGAAPASSGRTVAVLGEMLELGGTALDEHLALGRLVVELGITELVAVGPGAAAVHGAALQAGAGPAQLFWVPDVPAALAVLGDRLGRGDVVLVKASRGAGLERVAQGLLDADVDA
ncbi:MAG TPA: UDP-N-acetylmuramoyl-tripeptide--D-alanyl-D-alanine ligase [Nocardioidaceae bacterium]|nr:UDP-N-acetylmuramoyl-tripeptide--D-alanyl-D-alanine ligase [Nocardioidaceae bacterium]